MFAILMLILATVIITFLAIFYGTFTLLKAVIFYYITIKLAIRLYHDFVD